jgi:hypothetical protein
MQGSSLRQTQLSLSPPCAFARNSCGASTCTLAHMASWPVPQSESQARERGSTVHHGSHMLYGQIVGAIPWRSPQGAIRRAHARAARLASRPFETLYIQQNGTSDE